MPKKRVLYEELREPLLNSPAKYNELAKLQHVESKKQLFTAGVYSGSSGSAPTSSLNRKPKWMQFTRIPHPDRKKLGERLGEGLEELCKTKLCKTELSKTEFRREEGGKKEKRDSHRND